MLVKTAIACFARTALLSEAEQCALEAACGGPRRYPARHTLLHAGERAPGVFLILSGVAGRLITLSGGKAQVSAYLLPGEICGFRSLLLLKMDHAIRTLSPVEAVLVPLDRLLALSTRYPNLCTAFLRVRERDAAVSRQWLLNVGHRSAFAALAHLFCELFARLEAAGQVRESSCHLPLTQADLADALAISPVHLNRTLMKMRRAGFASLTGGCLRILDAAALRAAAKFDPAYLSDVALAQIDPLDAARPDVVQPSAALAVTARH